MSCASRKWADLVELVRSALDDVLARDKPRLAAQLCDALVAWGMSATSRGRKTELFRDALRVAREFKLSQETITSLIGESQTREVRWSQPSGGSVQKRNAKKSLRLRGVKKLAID